MLSFARLGYADDGINVGWKRMGKTGRKSENLSSKIVVVRNCSRNLILNRGREGTSGASRAMEFARSGWETVGKQLGNA